MAWCLRRPLITVFCHHGLTADLVWRYHVAGGETVWDDRPLARDVRSGAICYLEEIVEALTDDVETLMAVHELSTSMC